MSDYIPNPGRGTIFKQEDDKPAAYAGKVALPDGSLAFLDLFPATDKDTGRLKADRNGKPYYNIRLKPIGGGPSQRAQDSAPDFADDEPF
jgi:hypothetical protein